MKNRFFLIVLLVAVCLVVLPGCQRNSGDAALQSRATELEQENATLQNRVTELEQENTALQNRVAELEQENSRLREAPRISLYPKEGWEQYFPTAETTTLSGRTTAEIRELLGEPPFLIREGAAEVAYRSEIWIYFTEPYDLTGLYLFFKGDRLDTSSLNEFHGSLYLAGFLARPTME